MSEITDLFKVDICTRAIESEIIIAVIPLLHVMYGKTLLKKV